mmetsp:Transcript_11107/g.26654  ORF Transcript_11107/g.26654 Transcript_11107/m.26654 type:complete len:361 (+) Transcript_11107:144-1226(+)
MYARQLPTTSLSSVLIRRQCHRSPRRVHSSWNISPADTLTTASSTFSSYFTSNTHNKNDKGAQIHRDSYHNPLSPDVCHSQNGADCNVDKGHPCPVEQAQNLSPIVPPGARTVQVRGTNRRSVIQRALREQSIDVNYDHRAWQLHQQPWRNTRVWSPQEMWANSDLRRIMFPDVFQVGLVASGITYYNYLCSEAIKRVLDTDGDGDVSRAELRAGIDSGIVEAHYIMGTDFFITADMLTLSTTVPFTLTSMALGMMLTFRTQNCNARYNEARGLWGSMVNEGRALSSRVLSLVGTSHEPDSQVALAAKHMVQCIMTFSRTLKYHVTLDGHCPDLCIRMKMTDEEVNEAKGWALRQELANV